MMREDELTRIGNPEMHKSTELFEVSALLAQARELPQGTPLTYGATPLDRMATLQQQLELVKTLQVLTYHNIPDNVPMEIVDYVHTTFTKRFHNRAEANEENYMTSLYKDVPEAEYSPEILNMFKRGEYGQASPSELLLTRELRGIRSVELACLTHPYGERIKDELPEMREVVQSHVKLLGGTYFKDPETRYRVKEIVGYERGEEKPDKAVLMTRKRTLGAMPDGTIIRERSSFVLRLDDRSAVTEDEREAMKRVNLKQPDWEDALVKAGNLDAIAEILLKANAFPWAIPISSTIYAFNTETARAIEERDAVELARRRALFAKQSPIVAMAMENNEGYLKVVAEDRNGLFFVGPETASEEPIEL